MSDERVIQVTAKVSQCMGEIIILMCAEDWQPSSVNYKGLDQG
jgi:hypothetical protein